MNKRRRRCLGNHVLAVFLSVLLFAGIMPNVVLAKTGDTPITGFSAEDSSFVEGDLEWGDQYNLDFTDYTVTTNDGESYTGPMWDVYGWLHDKYPGLEFDGYVNGDKSDDPSKGKAGDSFKIVYYLDGFEAEWTLHIVEDPISEVTAGDITHIETDKFQTNDYRDAEGNWHDAEWQKYDFTPQLRIVLKNGEDYWDEVGMPDMVADWLLEQTGIRFHIDWNDDWGQNPPTGVGVGEYLATYHVGSHSGTYKGIVVENPIKNVELKEVKRLEGDTYLENGYNGADFEWHDEKWPKYDFSPYIKVTLTNGQVFEDGDSRKITDWVNEQTGLEIFPWWDDNTCQNPPYGIGVGEYTIEYEFAGFSGTYKASVIKNPIVSMTCDPTKIEIFEGNKQERIGYTDTDGGWNEDIKWYAYDTYPHCMTVKTADGQSIENADWWDCRQWLEQKYGLTFRDRIERDTQTPTSEWGVGEYPVTFGFGSASMNYTVSIVANQIQSVTGVLLNKYNLSLSITESERLTATVTPANATNKCVIWSSDDETVATVDENGTVTAVAAGTATITVTTEDGEKTASCEVTVVEAPPVTIDVESVSLDKAELELTEGESGTLTATISPEDATNKNVSWSSDDEAVATVDENGTVTAVAAGTATIIVTTEDGKKTAECVVVVNKQADPQQAVKSFVDRMYDKCLSRKADSNGETYWVDQLTGGSVSGAQVAEQFVFSLEANQKNLSDEKFVTLLYNAMMDRNPDEEGLKYWLTKLSNGKTRYEVLNGFVMSAEFGGICSDYKITRGTLNMDTVNIEKFVMRMYNKSLEREAEQEGIYYWTFRLRNHEENGATLADKVFFSDEMNQKNLDDDKFVELLYNAMMDRPSDEGGKAYWLNNISNGMTRKQVLSGFISSAEFTGICENYGIEHGYL